MSGERDGRPHDHGDEQLDEQPDEERDERGDSQRREKAPLEDLDAEEIVEGVQELFGAEHRDDPASDADAPPPG